MHTFFQRGLTLLYVLLTILSFLLVLDLSGIRMSDTIVLLAVIAWIFLCFSSVYFRTPLDLFFTYPIRKPVREEEEKLAKCFNEVRDRAGYRKKVRLMILEEKQANACAIGHNIIAVTPRLIKALSEEELKGVMAHELGHLVTKDCIVLSAFVTASDLPRLVSWTCTRLGAIALSGIRVSYLLASRINILLGVGLLLGLFYLFEKHHLFLPVFAFIAFLLLFYVLNRIFRFFNLLISRFAEYRQDTYAFQLGYGSELKDALKKLASHGPKMVNNYRIMITSSHPMIYNRIRRLEKLEALMPELKPSAYIED